MWLLEVTSPYIETLVIINILTKRQINCNSEGCYYKSNGPAKTQPNDTKELQILKSGKKVEKSKLVYALNYPS